MASIYERQGHKKEAIKIYEDILNVDPSNIEAQEGLRRLSGKRTRFSGINRQKRDEFVSMEKNEEFRKFEEWLAWV